MKTLDLTEKKLLKDFFYRYMSKLAKEKSLEEWIAWFVHSVVFKNYEAVKWIEQDLKTQDMTKMYSLLKNATLQ